MKINWEDKELLSHIEAFLSTKYRKGKLIVNKIQLTKHNSILCDFVILKRYHKYSDSCSLSLEDFNEFILPIYRQNKIEDILS